MIARAVPGLAPGKVIIEKIVGDNGRLSLDPAKNCIGVAAMETLRLLGDRVTCGISLSLDKVRMLQRKGGRKGIVNTNHQGLAKSRVQVLTD